MDREQWVRAISSLAIPDRYLSTRELARTFRHLAIEYSDFVTLEPVGSSSTGQPIEMLSVVGGPRSALVIGGSHGNEPVSSVAAESLARLLCKNAGLTRRLGYTWHIIASIDPDALDLNNRWMNDEPDLRSYIRGFFRPAFADQAEYTFPLRTSNYVWNNPSSENLAWQRALTLTRPQLHYSIHGADYGGIFFLTSSREPGLTADLIDLAPRYDIPLNPVGEPFLDTVSYGPALFIYPDIASMVSSSGDAGSAAWTAGQSSVGVATEAGAFSLTVEVPIWTDDRVTDRSPSGKSLRDVVEIAGAWMRDVEELSETMANLPIEAQVQESRLHRAATETMQRAKLQRVALQAQAQSDRLPPSELSTADYTLYVVQLRLLSLRTAGLLAQAYDREGTPAVRKVLAYIDRALCSAPFDVPLKRIPLRRAVGAQLDACIAAARALDHDRCTRCISHVEGLV